MAELISREAFKVIEGRPVTSSIKVAECFEKRHADVLRAIESLCENKAELRERNFALTEEIKHLGATTRKVPFYWMDRKGFSILAMGFTGAKALDFKCAFYDEFERMEKALAEPTAPEYLTPEQGWAIQSEVQKRVHADGVDFQTVYRALKAQFRVPKYTFLQSKDFNAAVEFIRTCELRAPVQKVTAPQPTKQDDACPHCGLHPIPPGSVVLSDEEARSLLSFIYTVRYLFADTYQAMYKMLRLADSPLGGAFYDAFYEVNWHRMLSILANHGHDIRDLKCYQHWLAKRRPA